MPLTPVTHLPASRHRAQPWKNGLGTSYAIAEFPQDASFDTVQWQVGTTRIGADCPFSNLPGLDRLFMVLEGAGVELTSTDEAGKTHKARVAPMALPHAFRGDWKTDCRLLDGPVRVLNVMTRRGRYKADFDLQGETRLTGVGGESLVAVDLKSLDAWMLDAEGTIELPPGTGRVAVVRIRAISAKRTMKRR